MPDAPHLARNGAYGSAQRVHARSGGSSPQSLVLRKAEELGRVEPAPSQVEAEAEEEDKPLSYYL